MADEETQFLFLMFADVPSAVIASQTVGADAGRDFLRQCLSVINDVREEHGGKVVRTAGSSVLCTFENGDDAINAGIAMQEAITTASIGTQTRPSLRIGIHVGVGDSPFQADGYRSSGA